MKQTKYSIVNNAKIGRNARIYDQVNLYGCEIGKNTKIDSYVYIEEGVKIGDNCKIRPFVFIPTGVVDEAQHEGQTVRVHRGRKHDQSRSPDRKERADRIRISRYKEHSRQRYRNRSPGEGGRLQTSPLAGKRP